MKPPDDMPIPRARDGGREATKTQGTSSEMKLETENIKETAASAELIRELMADDARRGNWLILMHDDDDEAFAQIAFDDHPDGVDLEYREGMNGKLYHCTRPVTRFEAENALLDYLDGLESWKSRFTWEAVKGYGDREQIAGARKILFLVVFMLVVIVLIVLTY